MCLTQPLTIREAAATLRVSYGTVRRHPLRSTAAHSSLVRGRHLPYRPGRPGSLQGQLRHRRTNRLLRPERAQEAARRSRTWTAAVCLQHGGGKVFLLTRQVNVVLRHPRRRVTHQLRQSLEVHAVEDRPGAERMPQAVQLGVVGDAGDGSVPAALAGSGSSGSRASCGASGRPGCLAGPADGDKSAASERPDAAE